MIRLKEYDGIIVQYHEDKPYNAVLTRVVDVSEHVLTSAGLLDVCISDSNENRLYVAIPAGSCLEHVEQDIVKAFKSTTMRPLTPEAAIQQADRLLQTTKGYVTLECHLRSLGVKVLRPPCKSLDENRPSDCKEGLTTIIS